MALHWVNAQSTIVIQKLLRCTSSEISTQPRELSRITKYFEMWRSGREALSITNLFKWGKTKPRERPVQEIAPEWQPEPPRRDQRIISFRVDDELDRKISRELKIRLVTRSEFIRAALERALQQDAQARLRAAHAAISWD
jgi:hypothetical protein